VNTNTPGAWTVGGHRAGSQSCWCVAAAAPPEVSNFFVGLGKEPLNREAKLKVMRNPSSASVRTSSPLFATYCALRPNPSIERTNCGLRPPFAAHVNR
jgi:hypothetical protein